MADSEDRPGTVIAFAEIHSRPGRGRGSGYGALGADGPGLQDPIFRLTLQRYGISPEQFASATPEVRSAVLAQIERALRNEVEGNPVERAQEILRQHLEQTLEERRETESSAPSSRTTPTILAALSGQFHSGDGTSYALALQYVNTAYQGYVYNEISAAYSGSQADRELGERIVRDVRAANEAIRAAGNRPWSPETRQTVGRAVASIQSGQQSAVTTLDTARTEIDGRIGRGETPGAAIEAEHERLDEGFRRHEANWRALDAMLTEAEANQPEGRRPADRTERHQRFAEYLADRVRGMYGGDRVALERAIEAARRFRELLGSLLNSTITSAQEFREAAQRALADGSLSPAERAELERRVGLVVAAERLDQDMATMQARLATLPGGPSPGGPAPNALSPELQAILARIEAVREGTSQENIFTITDELGTAIGALRGRGAQFARQRAELEARLRANPNDTQARAELDRMLVRARERHTEAGQRTDYDDPRAFFTRLATITDQQQLTRELEAFARYQNRERRIETMATVLGAPPENQVVAEAIVAPVATVPPAPGTGQAVQPQQVVAVEPERPASGQPKDAPSSALT